eukprot:COSAG01_NODE_3975_length_5476_cov_11.325646_6_plen_106_part_00
MISVIAFITGMHTSSRPRKSKSFDISALPGNGVPPAASLAGEVKTLGPSTKWKIFFVLTLLMPSPHVVCSPAQVAGKPGIASAKVSVMDALSDFATHFCFSTGSW